MGVIVALSQSVDNVLAIVILVGVFAVLVALVVFVWRRVWRSRESTPQDALGKVKERYVWGGFVQLGAGSSAASTFRQEAGSGLPAAITDAAISLGVGWIIDWMGVAIYRAVANRER